MKFYITIRYLIKCILYNQMLKKYDGTWIEVIFLCDQEIVSMAVISVNYEWHSVRQDVYRTWPQLEFGVTNSLSHKAWCNKALSHQASCDNIHPHQSLVHAVVVLSAIPPHPTKFAYLPVIINTITIYHNANNTIQHNNNKYNNNKWNS